MHGSGRSGRPGRDLTPPLTWLTKPLPIAHLPMENTVHYDLGIDLGIVRWNNATSEPRRHHGSRDIANGHLCRVELSWRAPGTPSD